MGLPKQTKIFLVARQTGRQADIQTGRQQVGRQTGGHAGRHKLGKDSVMLSQNYTPVAARLAVPVVKQRGSRYVWAVTRPLQTSKVGGGCGL